MGFVVKSEVPQKMYEGLMIAYTVKPLAGIPLSWVTEIKTVKDLSFFVDEQRVGPYKVWHHEHHFKAVEGGVEMTDIVTYVLPFGILGKLVHPWLVKPKLAQIFSYRFKKVDQLFG
jgi:ligand-binding SRPBCC domain-containing protein